MADSDSYPVPGNGWQSSSWRAPEPPGPAVAVAGPRFRQRYWLHALLFLLTLYSTTLVGARLAHNFAHNLPAFDIESDILAYGDIWADPRQLASGLPFSLTLLAILLAHEFGHYLACVYYQVDASLPYFIPAPTLIGTFGAFIRIRGPIYSRRALFDIGVAGPIAGFVFLLPALTIGLAYSKIISAVPQEGTFLFGVPPLLWLCEKLIFPGVQGGLIYLHPVARAAWIGVFATALNLLPIGQLDGGHILYAFVGERHRHLSRVFVLLLVPIGVLYWWGWLFWAAVLFFLGARHPTIYDDHPIGAVRLRLGLLALAMFVLSFMPNPFVRA
ncbi:MAG TPA: site-2 protease family protein [Bryobacterales bacterium]|nr:site-2 protease family protein [Bryobacterales bacterium]